MALTDNIPIHAPRSAVQKVPSQVSSRWHSITLQTPILWTTIQLHRVLWSTPVTAATAAKTIDLLKTVLDRGGNRSVKLFAAL
ncbi:hypothetical protein B0H17DRAFT_1111199, partial [Mycena rosella]